MKATAKAPLDALCLGSLAAAAPNGLFQAECPGGLRHEQLLWQATEDRTPHSMPTLQEALAAKGAQIFVKYGPALDWNQLLQLLADRSCVPFPCDLQFDAEPLLPGEFAHSAPKGLHPEDGFTIFIHPVFARQLSKVAYLVLHQLVLASYGRLVSPEDAEVFGSHALGLSQEEYYRALCGLAQQTGGG